MRSMERVVIGMRRNAVSIVIGIGMMIAGCGGGNELAPQKPEVVEGVRVQKIHLEKVADELETPGNVIAVTTAQVAARTMGTVTQVLAHEGDAVKRGQLLAQLDEREMVSRRSAAQAVSQGASAGMEQATHAVAAAQAQADVMKKTYDRYTYLKEQKSVSPQEYDEIDSKQQAAQANLEQAKARLREAQSGVAQSQSEAHAAESVASYARVVAPFDGRVMRRTAEAGSLVLPGMPLFVVEDTRKYQLEVTMPAEATVAIGKGTPVRVQLDSMANETLLGTVAEMEAGADASSQTVKARVDLPKKSGVQSGMFGRAFFSRGEKSGLVIAREAVVNRGQLRGIYVVDEVGLMHWRVVTLGKSAGSQIEVLSGLNDGEVVVLNPGSQELDGKKTGAGPVGGEKRP